MKAELATIHFGLAKTGTTYLQNYLFINKRELLEQYGVLYPGGEVNHYHFQTLLSDKPESLIQTRRTGITTREEARKFQVEFKNSFEEEIEKANPKYILISSEYFTSMSSDGLYKLKDFFLRYSKRVKAIIYVRDPWSFAVSAAQQQIRNGHLKAPTKMIYRNVHDIMIKRLEQVFEQDLIVRPYFGGEKERTDILDDFSGVLKLQKLSCLPQKSAVNPSLGRIKATALAILNDLWPQFDENSVYLFSKERDSVLGSIETADIDDERLVLSRLRAKDIMNQSKNDIDYIQNEYFEGKPLFAEYYTKLKFEDLDCDIRIENCNFSEMKKLMSNVCNPDYLDMWNRYVDLHQDIGENMNMDVRSKYEIYVLEANNDIVSGWCSPVTFEITAAINSCQQQMGIRGGICEIGVYQGKYFIALALLKNEGEFALAYDVFEDVDQSPDDYYGKSQEGIFRSNVEKYLGNDLNIIVKRIDSMTLSHARLMDDLQGEKARMFSVDGGHSVQCTVNDMLLAQDVLTHGGIIIIDDYFNAQWPGVAEGVNRFFTTTPAIKIAPFLVGANKIYFSTLSHHQKYLELAKDFKVGKWKKTVSMWGFQALTISFW